MKKHRKKLLWGLLLILGIAYVGQVCWINLQFRQQYHTRVAEKGEVLEVPEWGLSFQVLNIKYYNNIKDVETDYEKTNIIEPMSGIVSYWKGLKIDHYLLLAQVEIANMTEEEIPFNLMYLRLTGGYWSQVAQINFYEKIGDREDWHVTLAPGESQKIRMIFQFRDERGFHRLYREVKEKAMYFELLGGHVRNLMIVQ